jgi:hypothetical protein
LRIFAISFFSAPTTQKAAIHLPLPFSLPFSLLFLEGFGGFWKLLQSIFLFGVQPAGNFSVRCSMFPFPTPIPFSTFLFRELFAASLTEHGEKA